MLSFTIIQFQTTHNQIVYSLLHVHLFVSRFLYVLRWKCCSIAIEYIQCYTSTYWIDRLLRYFVSFFLNGAIINKLHYALNGFNSKVAHNTSTTHIIYWAFLFTFHTTFSNIILIDRSFHNWYGCCFSFSEVENCTGLQPMVTNSIKSIV